jgi:hypothetical protein
MFRCDRCETEGHGRTLGRVARVGWVERSETHQWVVAEMMGFGYRLYPSYTDYAQGVYQGDRPVKSIG